MALESEPDHGSPEVQHVAFAMNVYFQQTKVRESKTNKYQKKFQTGKKEQRKEEKEKTNFVSPSKVNEYVNQDSLLQIFTGTK